MCGTLSHSEKVYQGHTEKFTKEELKQRTTECWEEISLAESPLDRGKSYFVFGQFGEDGGAIDYLFA
jgi:hypothetical protein